MTKRTLDFVAALLGLCLLAPLFLLVAALVKLDSRGPVFFLQTRIGRQFRPFRIYKFRTMVPDAPTRGHTITCGDDPRITRVGRVLRRTKIDELPQLLNILRGDMSLVGPRPEVPEYVELFREAYRPILTVRPGLTDLASLKYRDEAALLARTDDPREEYVRRILPDKLDLARTYVRNASLRLDLTLIARTLLRLGERKQQAG